MVHLAKNISKFFVLLYSDFFPFQTTAYITPHFYLSAPLLQLKYIRVTASTTPHNRKNVCICAGLAVVGYIIPYPHYVRLNGYKWFRAEWLTQGCWRRFTSLGVHLKSFQIV